MRSQFATVDSPLHVVANCDRYLGMHRNRLTIRQRNQYVAAAVQAGCKEWQKFLVNVAQCGVRVCNECFALILSQFASAFFRTIHSQFVIRHPLSLRMRSQSVIAWLRTRHSKAEMQNQLETGVYYGELPD
jgi:hypothetical protein